MRNQLRTLLLFIAAIFMLFTAIINVAVNVPHLQEDMVEINVRRTLLRAVMLVLYFASVAMIAFAIMVLIGAVQSLRGAAVGRADLWVIAAMYLGFGIAAFVVTGSHHSLGYASMGLLIGVALLVPERKKNNV
jgi:hypothetical protein